MRYGAHTKIRHTSPYTGKFHKGVFKTMICPTCKSEIPDNSLICPSCQEEIETKRLREKCEATRKGWHDTLGKEFHKPLFLVVLIALAITFVGEVISTIAMLKVSIWSFVLMLIFCLIMLVSLIASLKLYIKKQFDVKDMKGLTAMCSLMAFFCVLSTIGVCAGSILLVIFGAALAAASTKDGNLIVKAAEMSSGTVSGGSADVSNIQAQIQEYFNTLMNTLNVGKGVIAAIIIVLAILLIVLFVNLTMTYTRAKKFYRTLMGSADGMIGQTKIVPPVKRLYFFGVIMFLAAIPIFITMGLTAICTIGLGVYTFFTGLFFKDVGAAYEANVAQLAREEEELKHAETETAMLRAKNKRIEEDKERARKAESDKLRAEQDAMFRQFMQQQMMNAKSAANTDNTAAAKDEEQKGE